MAATDYEEARLAAELAADTGLRVHLHTANPTEIGNVSEVAGGSYTPQNVTFTAAGSNVTNAGLLRWDDCGAVVVTHFSVSKGVNRKHYGALASPVTLAAGQPLEIPAAALVISWD
jgi:hypothetical protein